jgi:hypothetical protein
MIELRKAHRGNYWWDHLGEVMVDRESIESIEQCYERKGNGCISEAYTLIIMKSGAQHKVYGNVASVKARLKW